MNWKTKAFIQKIFDIIPAGEQFNYLAQKHVTRGLPVSESTFEEKISIARQHIEAFKQNQNEINIQDASFLEFGSGWDLIVPLTFCRLGIKKQFLIDIKPLLKTELINNALERLDNYFLKNGSQAESSFNGVQISTGKKGVQDLHDKFGIIYKAPMQAQNTDIEDSSIDCITSTSVIEHIPIEQLTPIMNECYRLLRKGGIASFIIDYKDHYAYFDPAISYYNFLQYSDQEWVKYNTYQQFQSRIRHKDFMEIVDKTNFELVLSTTHNASKQDLEKIRSLKIDKNQKFNKYSPEELGIQLAHIVLRK